MRPGWGGVVVHEDLGQVPRGGGSHAARAACVVASSRVTQTELGRALDTPQSHAQDKRWAGGDWGLKSLAGRSRLWQGRLGLTDSGDGWGLPAQQLAPGRKPGRCSAVPSGLPPYLRHVIGPVTRAALVTAQPLRLGPARRAGRA